MAETERQTADRYKQSIFGRLTFVDEVLLAAV